MGNYPPVIALPKCELFHVFYDSTSEKSKKCATDSSQCKFPNDCDGPRLYIGHNSSKHVDYS